MARIDGIASPEVGGRTARRCVDNSPVPAEQRVLDHADRRSDMEPVDVSVEADVEQIGDRMLVADALRSLPERSRMVIELAYLRDLTHTEIAEKFSIPLGTVKSDIRRGLANIRRHLEGAG